MEELIRMGAMAALQSPVRIGETQAGVSLPCTVMFKLPRTISTRQSTQLESGPAVAAHHVPKRKLDPSSVKCYLPCFVGYGAFSVSFVFDSTYKPRGLRLAPGLALKCIYVK